MPRTSRPLTGLALSGGAARCIAHIAVLDVLEVEGVVIDAIAGTSGGSIVGALYAAGMPPSEIKRVLLDVSWSDVLKLTVPRTGLISGEGIFRFMEKVLPAGRFSDLVLPFSAVATDLRSGERVALTSGSVARAVQASCSLPVIFTPAVIDRRPLVDGGVSSQVPVRTAREELGAKIVIAVNVNYRAMERDRFDSIISIAAHLTQLWASRNAREEEKLADAVISVNAAGILLHDLSKAKELLKRGRKAAEAKMPEIEALLQRFGSR